MSRIWAPVRRGYGARAVGAVGAVFCNRHTIFALAVWLGFKALDGLSQLVEEGWLSELSLISVVSLALIALTLAAASLAEQSAPRTGWPGLRCLGQGLRWQLMR